MRLTWLPDVLRKAGLTVHEQPGWETRGSSEYNPRGIICHETRGSLTSTDAGEIGVLLNGSRTAPPPIAQLYLSRSGEWWVIASGRCNHVLTGWAGPFKGLGNRSLLGIEAQHSKDERWTATQYDSYVRGVAAIRRHTGWAVAGHKEHQPGGYPGHTSIKTDPGFDMGRFRSDVDSEGDGILSALSSDEQRLLLKHVLALSARVQGLARLQESVTSTWSTQDPKGSDPLPLVALVKSVAARVDVGPDEISALAAVVPTAEENADAFLSAVSGRNSADIAAALRAVLGNRSVEVGKLLLE